jgi:hypothetical protein
MCTPTFSPRRTCSTRAIPNTFTADGKPQVKALETVLGYAITADERDEAWAKKPA